MVGPLEIGFTSEGTAIKTEIGDLNIGLQRKFDGNYEAAFRYQTRF